MDMTLDRMTSLPRRRASPPRTSSPLGCVSSGCSCCHRSLVSDCSARQGRTHLDMIKLEMKRTKSRQSGWQTWGISSIFLSWYSPFFLSFHVISPWLSPLPFLPSIHLCFLPSYLRLSCPLSFISSLWLWSLSFYLLFFNSRLPLTIPSFLSSILVSPYSSICLHYSHIFLERIIMFSRLYVIICSYTLIWACVQTCTQPAKCFVGKKNHATVSYFWLG